MSDMRLYTEWDRGIKKVELVAGDGPGLGATFDVTVNGMRGGDSVLRYVTTEYQPGTTVLLEGRNRIFTSIDRITVQPAEGGCDVTYDARLSFNGVLAPFNILLGGVFKKVGDSAAKGMRKKLQ
jgi:hypothetical protein